ncbi:putative DDE superfamily endonuclease [Monocercomonoides exilis]|uniref:putative DDE superfamily endonuclease n=1 Tax=Monocercomonoides exilis TaxID=2049356 RepID=UPI003559F4BA|nr:putative DDE superfamily endonuclease [Monocercomonoides exilis]|eukprot:MONOS_5418.1-p1 / transcript=MONOS_5418.1 / gene=MONOS_5418 / organism=Monocercomonoides_exilis_PA203 / gene_product=unspecified product / transcript_product=unspecified product / location=Mono_scaffold00157:44532-45491(-) / protein_length=319 / sequence_SO=supercontig / SO=protein_coding / is_pseudo=false
MENVINDTDDEDAPYVDVSMATAYQFVKRHPELKRSSPKNVDFNRLAVSCQSVLQPWYSLLDGLHEKNEYCKELIFNMDESSLRVPTNSKLSVVHPKNENPGFRKEPPKMANSTLVAAVAADGFVLPSVILWPSKSLPDEMKPLLSQALDIWPNGSGWMGCNQFKKYALTTLLQGIIDRRKRMSLENSRCLLLIDSHISRVDPTIWREFQKENIDVVTFIPHSTHIAQPLDRGVFAVLKKELQTKYEPPSSSTSSSKRTALVDVLPQAIHTALSPAVIKKAFATSGVLHNESGPILMKLLETLEYQPSSHSNRFDLYGK